MGSTLEHGIYLPSEGEKNCYSGLANNWQTVDTNIGYVTSLRQAIAGALTRQIVTRLPTENIDPNCIYMILKATAQTSNIYDEYMYINSNWELIGDSQLDLSNYYTKQQVNELPAVASGVTSTKVGNYDTHIADNNVHVTVADKSKWDTVALIKQLRLVNTKVGSATTIAFSDIDDTNGIKVGDKCMDLDGKLFAITAVDTANETVSVTTPLTQLAVDSSVMHLSGDESASGNKNFEGLITTSGQTLWPSTTNTTDDITYLGSNAIHVEYKSSGKLTDLSGGAWSVAELGAGCFFFRANSGTDIRYRRLGSDTTNRIPVVSGTNRFINDVTPNQDNTYNLGSSSLRWKTINNINPGALSLPDLDNGIDISGFVDVTQTSQYTAPADGYISICGYASSTNAILIKDHDYDFAMTFRALTTSLGATTYFVMPVIKNHVYDISCSAVTNIAYAKFFPCLGNV